MKSSAHPRGGAPAPTAGKQRQPRAAKENVDPSAPPSVEPSPFRPSAAKPLAARNRSPLPLRPLKRKLSSDPPPETGAPASDSGVQVIVRIRPPSKEEDEADLIAKKISGDSLSVLDHGFTFDAVTDAGSTQEDIFRLVGLPLVENCLAGFNSSIFAYGQTGSGKTYTMWGPTSALLEDEPRIDEPRIEWGLTPRVFQRLFTRLSEEQAKNSDKQLSYQCRCSFLEIYNEQITDLLDPTQKNLQIREDVKNGVYVDYLTEEFVSSVKDVIQLLTKGLANRRTGATGMNAESSRSHCVFTCVVESRSKTQADGLSSFRTSKINLVDLAGSERQKLTGAEGERLKEAGNINRSLSQLGNLINILAEVSQSGKQRHIPYRDSKLTFLLQDSLGGNAKLAMICAISASQSCQNETISTLRFAQNAKAIKNKAVVNEVTQDDVNVLREQIRQLKDELLRMKSSGTSAENNGSSTGWNARRSLNLLRLSLNIPAALSVVEEDNDEEMEIDEDDHERPLIQAGPCEENIGDVQQVHSENSSETKISSTDAEMIVVDTSLDSVVGSGCEDQGGGSTDVIEESRKLKEVALVQLSEQGCKFVEKEACCKEDAEKVNMVTENILDNDSTALMNEGKVSHVLQSPTSSTSPRVKHYSRKSLRTSISSSASQDNKWTNVDSCPGILSLSFAGTLSNVPLKASVPSDNVFAPTEHLEANLLRGLQAIDNHQCSSSLRRSSFRFPVKSVDLSTLVPVKKVDVGTQTLHDESIPICINCENQAPPLDYKDANNGMDLQLIPSDGSQLPDKCQKQVPKVVEKVLAGAIRREMALEDHCAKQAAEILQLNRLVQQYKHERECSTIIEQIREDKIARLESLMDGTLSNEEFMEEEFISLGNEHNLLKEKYENHPEVLRVNIEHNGVQRELDEYKNFFDLGERDVLMEEIQDLRNQLKFYTATSHTTQSQSPLFKLTQSNETHMSPPGTTVSDLTECVNEKLKEERRYWTETESRWISLSEELRIELEASRSLAEKRKNELDCEKKCTEELKEALEAAMQGHARLLDQYADLQEKHIILLGRHGKISDGIEDVKKATAKAGIKGAAYRFVKSLAAEISAMKVERDKERQQLRGENKRLQAQARDTAEAVQAAGELLVRLKEAEEAATVSQKRTLEAEERTKKAYEELDIMKKNYERQICMLNQFLAESRLPKEALRPTLTGADAAKFEGESLMDTQYRSDLEPFHQSSDNEHSHESVPCSWFSGYDQCNI